MWWLLNTLVAFLGSGWSATLLGFGQGIMAVSSLPGMFLFALRGALSGDAKKALGLLIWLGTLAFVGLFLVNSYYSFHRIWEEEEAGTATGCSGKRSCAKMEERARNVPAQIALCNQWERECKWNAWDRAWLRYTDIFPTRAELTSTWHYQALALCVIASIGHALLILTYRCLSAGKKLKRKKEAADAQRFRTAVHAKTEATLRESFPVA